MPLPSFILQNLPVGGTWSTKMPWEIDNRESLPRYTNRYSMQEKEEFPFLNILEEESFDIYDISSVDIMFNIIRDGYDSMYFLIEVEKLYNIILYDEECEIFEKYLTFRDIHSLCKFISGECITLSNNISEFIADYNLIENKKRNYTQLLRDMSLDKLIK